MSDCRRLREAISIAVGLLAILLSVAGCSVPGDAAPVVKIGLIAPFEGIGRPLGYNVLSVVKTVLETTNSGTGLGGYRVALVALNDDSDASTAAARARALLQDDEVMAVVGLWSSPTARAVAPILENAGIPTLLAAPFADDSALIHSLCPSPDEIAAEMLSEANRLGSVASVAVAGPQNVLNERILALAPDTFRAQEGADTPCGVSAGEHADRDCVVLYTGDATGAAEDLKRWRAGGWGGLALAGPDAAQAWLPRQAGHAAEGTRAIVCLSPLEVSGRKDHPLFEQASLAEVATKTVLGALERDIAAHGRPSRPVIAAELNQGLPAHYLDWLEIRDGLWDRRMP